MTPAALLHLERDRARLWRPGAGQAVECALDPLRPARGLETLARDGAATRVVLVIGVSLLECARVTLPPVAAPLQRRMLRADAARFFALDEAVAVGCEGPMAWAMPSTTLRALRDAVAGWGIIDAIVPLPVLLARAGMRGSCHLPASAGTHAALELRDGRVHEVRHAGGPVPGTPTPVDWAALCSTGGARRWTLEDQLLDADGEAALVRRERRRWTAASVGVVVALALLLMAVDTRQARRHAAVATAVVARDSATRDAQGAVRRLVRARDELGVLAAPAAVPSALDVLARIGARLPRDVTIDALEWDAEGWRLQGTARDAAILIPTLAGDSLLTDVRSLAPSTRFVEDGRQRSSFRIGFRIAPRATTRPTRGPDGR